MKIIVISILLMCVVAMSALGSESHRAKSTTDEPYLSIFFYNGSQITSNNQFGSQSGEGREFGGSFTARADGSTTLASMIPFEEPPVPVLYELSYIVGLHQDSDSLMLRGVIYSLDMNGEDVVGGTRHVINTPIAYDEPLDMHFTPAKGQPLTIRFLMQSPEAKAESEEVVYGGNTITVKSTCWVSGVTSKTSSTQTLAQEARGSGLFGQVFAPMEFPATFTTTPTGTRDEALSYRVTISFEPPIRAGDYPEQTTMKLSRQYWLDTVHTVGQPVKADWMTGSAYSKKIELEEGKLLKLVFPPEEQLLRGFKIEDTVIINP